MPRPTAILEQSMESSAAELWHFRIREFCEWMTHKRKPPPVIRKTTQSVTKIRVRPHRSVFQLQIQKVLTSRSTSSSGSCWEISDLSDKGTFSSSPYQSMPGPSGPPLGGEISRVHWFRAYCTTFKHKPYKPLRSKMLRNVSPSSQGITVKTTVHNVDCHWR